ncbi:MAG: NAD kinase [Burkholderiales bacterium]|nr:NAD kinase [Burkholderiales bacterium]
MNTTQRTAQQTATFQTVALIGKYKSPEIAESLLQLAAFLKARGVTVLLDRLTSAHVGACGYPVLLLEEIGRGADLAIVLGGDGTMLNIARTLAPYEVALVGVNQGRLGFLTDISIDTMFETIGAILDGQYVAEDRMLLDAEVFSSDQSVFSVLAFNDVVVSKGMKSSMIEFEVRIDGCFLYRQRSDGLIIASPTGSTAYALSAGGPVLHPGLNLMALVPICPHTFSTRPIVVNSGSVIEVLMRDSADARAHFDSHSNFDLRKADRVVIRRYANSIRLLHPLGHDYYHTLREKLHWSETL